MPAPLVLNHFLLHPSFCFRLTPSHAKFRMAKAPPPYDAPRTNPISNSWSRLILSLKNWGRQGECRQLRATHLDSPKALNALDLSAWPFGCTNQGVCEAVNAIPASAEDTAGVELANVAKGAATVKPEALEPWAEGMAGRGHDTAPREGAIAREHELETPVRRAPIERGHIMLPRETPQESIVGGVAADTKGFDGTQA